ncbi:hypothetical protein DSO57_1001674 [Entomophthora muscae]|uniref:Uncharacterized protein n=1 Tax=Entomophthora muscae TaxID=34485 RepID=A0ACC2TVZ0_9FUNG|nr:hypothetical protein DSO57_1001674 [Entomophthora muscae]
MRCIVAVLFISLFTQATTLPSSTNAEGIGESGSKVGGIDVNKPAAIVTAEAMRAFINTVLAESVALNMVQSTEETINSVMGPPKHIN